MPDLTVIETLAFSENVDRQIHGLLIDESFEGTGAEETWDFVSSLGSGSVLDPDSTDVTPPSGGGSQTLKVQKVSPNFVARADHAELVSGTRKTYTRFYVRISAVGFTDNGQEVVLATCVSHDYAFAWQVKVVQYGGQLCWRLRYFDVNDLQSIDVGTAVVWSLNTWIKVEVEYDADGKVFDWIIDDNRMPNNVDGNYPAVLKGSLTDPMPGNMTRWWIGDTVNDRTFTGYFDLFQVSTESFEEAAALDVSLSDTLSSSESISPQIGSILVSLSDALASADDLSKRVGDLLASLSETLSTAEEITARIGGVLSSVSDGVVTAEEARVVLGGLLTSLSETLQTAEQVTVLTGEALVAVTESVGIDESLAARLGDLLTQASDSFSTAEETTARIGSLLASASDTVSISEDPFAQISSLLSSVSSSLVNAEEIQVALGDIFSDASDTLTTIENIATMLTGISVSWGWGAQEAVETASSWQEWETSAGVKATVVGDQDWGDLKVFQNLQVKGPIRDSGSDIRKSFGMEKNKYSGGTGQVKVYIRGSLSEFGQHDVSPGWAEYTDKVFEEWRFSQLMVEFLSAS